MVIRVVTHAPVCLNFQNHLGIVIPSRGIYTLMVEVGAGIRKLGKTILFVQLEDWAGRPGLSTSHNVGARGTAVCFWFTPVILAET